VTDAAAVTQNYCSEGNLAAVLRHLRDKPHLVSGVPDDDRPDLGARFAAALRETDADAALLAGAEREIARLDAADAKGREKKSEASTWGALVGGGGAAGGGGGGFSFGFGLG